MADVIDYGEVKTGARLTGMVYASVVFFIKMGIAVGGAFAGWLLAFYGYDAQVAPTQETKQGILWSFTVYSSLGSFIVAGVMSFYRLDGNRVEHIHQQLAAKPAGALS
jgi:GPH family glycoside/pentoside/hexuronide:cation symporter